MHWTKSTITSLVFFVGAITACATEDADPSFRSIDPVCVESADAIQATDWTCEDDLVIDCNVDEAPGEIFVLVDPGGCGDVDLATIDGPFAPGQHEIIVVDENTGQAVCASTLEVHDNWPPQIETIDQSMWPPNHKFETFILEDCFAEVVECDPLWTARLTYVSSDEPANERGDGNTEPDIVIVNDTQVELRSERQGGSNGRVYTLGWLAEDGSGNVAEGTCLVTVDHDQGKKGIAIDDGPAYRVDVD